MNGFLTLKRDRLQGDDLFLVKKKDNLNGISANVKIQQKFYIFVVLYISFFLLKIYKYFITLWVSFF